MTKRELIRKLEGREVQTADGLWHLVKNGRFQTSAGECRLAEHCRYHLGEFLKYSRLPLASDKEGGEKVGP